MDDPFEDSANHDFDRPAGGTVTPMTNMTDFVGVTPSGQWGAGAKSKDDRLKGSAEQAPESAKH